MTFTLAAVSVSVNPTAPFAFISTPVASIEPAAAERARLEADYAAYGEWLAANADSLAADYEAEEAVESGHWAW